MSDKRILHIISVSALAALSISFLFSNGGRAVAAVLMAIICAVTVVFIKKRGIPNFVYLEIAAIMSVIAAVYVTLYYLTGLKFGFSITSYGLSAGVIFKYVIPIAVIIISTELVRGIMRAQEDRAADILSYLSCVAAEVLIHYNLSDVVNFKRFMDIVAMVLLPALLSNFLYHYLAKRYSAIPNIPYRLIITLYPYIIPYKTRIPDSLLAFVNLILPLIIYVFIDYLYEKKKKCAFTKTVKLGVAITVASVILMSSFVMLVSNAFRFGAYVIATESMTGDLTKGDIAIYEQYGGKTVKEGQIIVFEKNGSIVIHRVAEVTNINGQNRYYTKGDANGDLDQGYVTDKDIIGTVESKIPYFGYPTLWLRETIKKVK